MNGTAPVSEETAPLSIGPPDPTLQHPVLHNTLLLAVAQIVSTPLSILVSAVTARYLGPAALGYMYLGATFNTFAFLVVEWGQSGALPALVAADRSRAGPLLGSSLAWRSTLAIITYPVLLGLCRLLGYGHEVRVVVALFFIGYTVSAMTNACVWVIMGLERVKVAAYRQVFEQFMTLLIVVPILMLGGGVNATLVGHAATTLVVLVYVSFALRSTHVGRLSADLVTLKTLVHSGTPFVFIGVVMVLQPTIDAGFLSKLASPDVVGWYSAARKLIGFLVFPASALVGGLYPTLCRLHGTDSDAFKETVSSALRWTSALVIPIALGCALYPDVGIALYSRKSFLPAEDNLRFMSLFLFLLYFTMPLGISIVAAGKQRTWALVQGACVIVSLVLDPILVPWFQRRMGNGGLGLCVAAVVSELIVLGCAIALVQKGILGPSFWRSLLPICASGAVMILAWRVLLPVTSFIAAPIAVGAYGGSLWITGGIDRSFVALVRGLIGRKLSRRGPE
jgi:O-antigen/teichoic acid export membrane protein